MERLPVAQIRTHVERTLQGIVPGTGPPNRFVFGLIEGEEIADAQNAFNPYPGVGLTYNQDDHSVTVLFTPS